MRDDLQFFSHDTNAQDHPKMQALIAELGFEGYGRFWALNERIGSSSGSAIDVSKKVNKMSLARSLGLNEAGIDRFLAFLSDPGIDLVNISGEGILTTDRTQEDYQITREGREKGRDRVQKHREKNVTRYNADVTPENADVTRYNADVTRYNADVTRYKTTDRVDRVDRVDLPRERDTKSGGGRSDHPDPPGGKNPVPEEPPPPFDLIKSESAAAGFVIPDNLAAHLADTTDPPWLSGPDSYFRFVAEQLRDSYRTNRKTGAEMRKLYLSALWNGWENYRKTYPAWREGREAEAARGETERLRNSPPETCPRCGGAVERLRCQECGGFFEFLEDSCQWEFTEKLPLHIVF
ncbi:MAG: DUF4373 domain-containing protein [Treponema sp.]|jgi:hypothetical protein|nr:DUF4373 domain-containing protein [Treponema sp.]